MLERFAPALLGLLLLSCDQMNDATTNTDRASGSSSTKKAQESSSGALPRQGRQKALLAGGCFWCMEKPFEKLDAVYAVISGYSGGQLVDPTYRQVSAGTTGHAEVVEVEYDAAKISYEEILEVFWRQINPTDAGGQFGDRGSQYRSEIFYLSAAQKAAAEQSKAALMASGRFDKPIQTGITKATKFYPAEEYHQDYYKKEPAHYHSYRRGSGRDRYLDRVWGKDRIFKVRQRKRKDMEKSGKLPFTKPSDEELQKMLTSIQYRVTQSDGTESAFKNSYWDNKRAGIYVDIVSGEALFSSKDKFDSKSGWPSFTRPLAEKNIKESTDNKIGYARTEIRSIKADSHLGHLFNDGPAPTGKRYCINSAALRFVPVEDLEKAGYGSFMKLFK